MTPDPRKRKPLPHSEKLPAPLDLGTDTDQAIQNTSDLITGRTSDEFGDRPRESYGPVESARPMNIQRYITRARERKQGAKNDFAGAAIHGHATSEQYPTDEPTRDPNDRSQPDINKPVNSPGLYVGSDMDKSTVLDNAQYNQGLNKALSQPYKVEPGMTGWTPPAAKGQAAKKSPRWRQRQKEMGQ